MKRFARRGRAGRKRGQAKHDFLGVNRQVRVLGWQVRKHGDVRSPFLGPPRVTGETTRCDTCLVRYARATARTEERLRRPRSAGLHARRSRPTSGAPRERHVPDPRAAARRGRVRLVEGMCDAVAGPRVATLARAGSACAPRVVRGDAPPAEITRCCLRRRFSLFSSAVRRSDSRARRRPGAGACCYRHA
jgi:hypothetical protein